MILGADVRVMEESCIFMSPVLFQTLHGGGIMYATCYAKVYAGILTVSNLFVILFSLFQVNFARMFVLVSQKESSVS